MKMSRGPQQGSKLDDQQGAPWRIHLMELCRSGLAPQPQQNLNSANWALENCRSGEQQTPGPAQPGLHQHQHSLNREKIWIKWNTKAFIWNVHNVPTIQRHQRSEARACLDVWSARLAGCGGHIVSLEWAQPALVMDVRMPIHRCVSLSRHINILNCLRKEERNGYSIIPSKKINDKTISQSLSLDKSLKRWFPKITQRFHNP